MTIKEIVKKYLEDNGFDGLLNEDLCGCGINDLMPCDEPLPDCKPGYKVSLGTDKYTELSWNMVEVKP